jgi:hypothetical protein
MPPAGATTGRAATLTMRPPPPARQEAGDRVHAPLLLEIGERRFGDLRHREPADEMDRCPERWERRVELRDLRFVVERDARCGFHVGVLAPRQMRRQRGLHHRQVHGGTSREEQLDHAGAEGTRSACHDDVHQAARLTDPGAVRE